MSNKQSYRVIEHPDEFIEGNRYSVLFEGTNGFKRVSGVFIDMFSRFCVLCNKRHLLIRLKRKQGTIELCWNSREVKDWREI